MSHTTGMHNSHIVPLAGRDDAPGTIVERRRIWVDELLAEAPIHPHGTFNYSNGGYVVAGAMLETIKNSETALLSRVTLCASKSTIKSPT